MAPPVFKPLTFPQAQAAAAGKLVIVDFSAEWCQPCKHMDRTAWVDPQVVAWIDQHAVAIQLDGDHSPLAQEWSVQAYPTLIAFRGDKEIDRTSGARSGAALIKWLDAVNAGRTELDEMKAGVAKDDVTGQFRLASLLADKGRDDEALEIFVWLWEHSLEIEPSWVGVRGSYLMAALEPLLERSEKARARFEQLRDAAEGRAFSDFVTLNAALGDQDKTLEVLRKMTAKSSAIARDHQILELIEERGEFALFGRLIDEPLAVLAEFSERLEEIKQNIPPEFPKEQVEPMLEHFEKQRHDVGELFVRSLEAAGRDAEAAAVEASEKKH